MTFPPKPELRMARRLHAKLRSGHGLSAARVHTGRRDAAGEVSLKRHRFSLRKQTSAMNQEN